MFSLNGILIDTPKSITEYSFDTLLFLLKEEYLLLFVPSLDLGRFFFFFPETLFFTVTFPSF